MENHDSTVVEEDLNTSEEQKSNNSEKTLKPEEDEKKTHVGVEDFKTSVLDKENPFKSQLESSDEDSDSLDEHFPIFTRQLYRKLHKITNNSIPNSLTPITSFGISNSRPVPKPRRHVKSQIINSKKFDSNSSSGSEDTITIIRRAPSILSIDFINQELSSFYVMDEMKSQRKKPGFFQKFLPNSFSSAKEKTIKQLKKKNEEKFDNSDNFQKEIKDFQRNAPHRHTLGGQSKSFKNTFEIENEITDQDKERYAKMHVDKFNKIKSTFSSYQPEEKNLQNSPTSSHRPLSKSGYIKKYSLINDSSESSNGNEISKENNPEKRELNGLDGFNRNTPPRALETKQDVKLVNPKNLFVNSSERSAKTENNRPELNVKDNSSSTAANNVPILEDVYGTVFDHIDSSRKIFSPNHINAEARKLAIPLSPKLKLPANRQQVTETRLKSPIPHDKPNTEKIIATELLKGWKTSGRTDSIQTSPKPDEANIYEVKTKPPLFPKPSVPKRVSSLNSKPENEKSNGNYENVTNFEDKTIINAVVHAPPQTPRSPTPKLLIQNRALSPLRSNSSRSTTPIDSRPLSIPRSPQKEEIRKSVEAYYWKELKKMKEQEEQELYAFQMQLAQGFGDDSVMLRRSRSMSPSFHRSRRSLSLPRDPRLNPNFEYNQIRMIPEERVSSQYRMQSNQIFDSMGNPVAFTRNSPQRSTINGSSPNYEVNYNRNSLHRPIFKRGSLTQEQQVEEQQKANKNVKFISGVQNSSQPWPTRHGFTKSPPQRRIIKNNEDDDVFIDPSVDNESSLYGTLSSNGNFRGSQMSLRIMSEAEYVSRAQMLERQYKEARYRLENERIYGQIVPVPTLTRHESLIMGASPYKNTHSATPTNIQYYRNESPSTVNYKMDYQLRPHMKPEANVVQPQETKRSFDPIYGTRNEDQLYGVIPKQVIVRNKYCDMYGKIHDSEAASSIYGTNPNQKSGVLMGKLQSPQSPGVNPNFVRNSRLTSSAGDMFRLNRASNQGFSISPGVRDDFPDRPLPPLPNGKTNKVQLVRLSDTETNSETSEITRIMNNGAKTKKRSLFGK